MLPTEKQVFSLGNKNAVGNLAKYQKGTKTVSNYLGGICTSIALRWIRQTIRNGNLTSASELGDIHSMNIAFGAADIKYAREGMNGHFQAHSLKVTRKSEDALRSYSELTQKLSTTKGMLCLVIRDSAGAGHAVGFKISPGRGDSGFYYLDPNDGL
jgi:hypothetical protein